MRKEETQGQLFGVAGAFFLLFVRKLHVTSSTPTNQLLLTPFHLLPGQDLFPPRARPPPHSTAIPYAIFNLHSRHARTAPSPPPPSQPSQWPAYAPLLLARPYAPADRHTTDFKLHLQHCLPPQLRLRRRGLRQRLRLRDVHTPHRTAQGKQTAQLMTG